MNAALWIGGVLAFAGIGLIARAETYIWTGATNSLLNGAATNWSPEAAPGAGDALVFDGTGQSYSTYRVGTGVSPSLGGATGLASISLTAGQTGAVTLVGQTTAGSATYRMDVGGSVSVASGAGALTFGGSGSGMTIALGGGTATASGVLTFTNQSSNAAAIGSNVSINRGGSGGGSRGIAFAGAGNWNVAATITGVDYLNKTGSGTLTFSGTTQSTSLVSGVTISGGTFNLTGSLANTTSAVTLGAAGTLAGTGTVAGATTINGTLTGGLTFEGAVALGATGQFNWRVRDAQSVFDTATITATGSLDLSALSAANKFTINLWSISAPDTNGAALNFDPAQNHVWTLFSTDTAISGFSASYFQINTGAGNGTGGFANALNGGAFSVALSGDGTDVVLHFTAGTIPEPGAYPLLAGVAGLVTAWGFRRRGGSR